MVNDDEARLADLKSKLKARENKTGFSANVEALKKLIAETEGRLNGD